VTRALALGQGYGDPASAGAGRAVAGRAREQAQKPRGGGVAHCRILIITRGVTGPWIDV